MFNFMAIDSSRLALMHLFTGWVEDSRFAVL
jgi:hypothetical protein